MDEWYPRILAAIKADDADTMERIFNANLPQRLYPASSADDGKLDWKSIIKDKTCCMQRCKDMLDTAWDKAHVMGEQYWSNAHFKARRHPHCAHSHLRRLLQEKQSEARSLLTNAAAKGHTAVVEFLLGRGEEVDQLDATGSTSLYWASLKNQVQAVKMLLQRSADVNTVAKDRYGVFRTPLYIAAESNHIEVVKLLLGRNADQMFHIDAEEDVSDSGNDSDAGDPLDELPSVNVVTKFDSATVQNDSDEDEDQVVVLEDQVVLSECGTVAILASPSIPKQRAGGCNTECIICGRCFECIQRSTSKCPVCRSSKSPVHIAVSKGHLEVVRLLLEHNICAIGKTIVNLTAKSSDGGTRSPLLQATINGHCEMVNLLLKHGADANLTHDGFTPLHAAAVYGYREIARLLLASQGCVNRVCTIDEVGMCYNLDFSPRTPLLEAVFNGKVEVAALLLDHGADVNFLDDSKRGAVSMAAQAGDMEMATLLLKHGSNANQACNTATIAVRYDVFVIGKASSPRAALGSPKLNSKAYNYLYDGTPRNFPYDWQLRIQGPVTPIYLASAAGYTDMVKLLLANKVDINVATGRGQNPSELGIGDVVRKQAQDRNHSSSYHKRLASTTPLYIAAYAGHEEIVRLLLAHGADADSTMAHATAMGDTDVVRMLRLKIGALACEAGGVTSLCDCALGFVRFKTDKSHPFTYSCDRCEAEIAFGEDAHCCSACEFSLCSTCFVKRSSSRAAAGGQASPLQSFTALLSHTHELQLTTLHTGPRTYGTHECDLCAVTIPECGYRCKGCDFDVCVNCAKENPTMSEAKSNCKGKGKVGGKGRRNGRRRR
jgi:ankyrin repeat protein